MRGDRKKEKEQQQQNNTGFVKFSKFCALLFFAVSLMFGAMLVLANILPPKYLLVAGLIELLLFVIVFPPLYSRKTKNVQRTIALIMSGILIIIYLFGVRYLASTMSFMSQITRIGATDEYYVVVRDDDMFNELTDIEGETVYAYQSSESHGDAIEELKSRVEIEVVSQNDIGAMIEHLLSGEINVTFMSSGSYEAYNESSTSFDDYTKIIDRFKIKHQVVDISKPVEVAKESFNMYITGVDTEGTIDVTARSDVNMVATVNPVTRTILLTSIPRDYYVMMPDVGAYDKLTHAGLKGANYTVATVEKLLGIDINYYIKVNFTTVVNLVDEIGGIDIESEYTFTTSDGNYYFVEGMNYDVDGAAALRFARERYAFSDGDFQRNKDQQIVLTAIINKISQSSVLLTNYTDILKSIENNIEMNMAEDELKSFIRMQTNDMSSWNVVSQNITGTTGSDYCYSFGQFLSVVWQDQGSINAAVEKIRAVMAGETLE
ncbi:MAG: LCP family protein [Firmicutes bacterium]|nr:LCP family protein [Bacillota bacterium]